MGPRVVVDHVFVCVRKGAPEAEKLIEFGLREGAPNVHPGQGTANRRFFFDNAMLELIWVQDPAEAQSEQTRRTRLWERWSRAGESCPFGIILRAAPGQSNCCPFEAWEYRPEKMPGLILKIASATALSEPMWAYFEMDRLPRGSNHPVGVRAVTGIRLQGTSLVEGSVTAAMVRDGVIGWEPEYQHVLTVEFDGHRAGRVADFRPELPLVFEW